MEKLIPQNNFEGQKGVKTLAFEFEGKDIKLEYRTSYFEYPEAIQKETGILGYERKIISENDLKTVTEKFSNEPEILEKFSKALLLEITDSQFPNECFTYMMNVNQAEKQQFADDKFLLQNIFGLESLEDLYFEKKDPDAFNARGNFNPDETLFNVFDKSTNKKDQSFNNGNIQGIFSNYYRNNKLQEKNLFAVSANGLNVSNWGFFFNDFNVLEDKPTFGFSRKDNLFQDYISKSIDRLREINKVNLDDKNNKNPLFSEGIFLELFDMKESAEVKDDKKYRELMYELGEDKGEKLFSKYGSPFSKKDTSSLEKYKSFATPASKRDHEAESLTDFLEYLSNMSKIVGQESQSHHIPIFIENDSVQQLKWGHATFATFKTKNGLNILEIKHSNHLPEKNQE